ncbi:hypothetical protein XM38_024610 [Halomicronema hongdechloris C2206]|uniref:Uncharacterized protein n=1 Tax=Halomicronema hongdechloris C2206 TaxID=1641165 RepID=A0A1Z3HMH4_9CYAN|nr:hypothetical protein XM38_024610 [Halomicronema hongdechloris C2206]
MPAPLRIQLTEDANQQLRQLSLSDDQSPTVKL